MYEHFYVQISHYSPSADVRWQPFLISLTIHSAAHNKDKASALRLVSPLPLFFFFSSVSSRSLFLVLSHSTPLVAYVRCSRVFLFGQCFGFDSALATAYWQTWVRERERQRRKKVWETIKRFLIPAAATLISIGRYYYLFFFVVIIFVLLFDTTLPSCYPGLCVTKHGH